MNHHPSPATPSAVLRRGALSRISSLFRAKSPKGGKDALKSPPTEMQTILLPHARTRWMTPYAANMTPARIEQILRSCYTGDSPVREQELYALMESTWPRLLKNTMEIKDAVLGLDWQLMDVEEGDQFPGAKELIERTKNGMKGDPYSDGHGWRATLGALLDAKWRGVSICEIVWEYREGRKAESGKQKAKMVAAWLPKMTRDLPAQHFGWQVGDGRLRLYPEQDSSKAVDFPPHQFLCGISKAGKGHPSGTALLRCLAWWWCSANFSSEWLLNFAQIFGQPFRWATYDASQEGVKEDLAAMMEAMGSAAYGVGPDGTKIEWHEASKSGADNPQSYILTLADTACDLLILGQTLTSTQGSSGSLALGEVHQSVRADIIDSTALWLAEILNEQLIPAVIALNYGDGGEDSNLPWFQPARKSQKDTKVLAETFKLLLEAGIPLKQDEVYDAIDMSKPEATDEIFGKVESGKLKAEMAEATPGLSRMLAKLPLDAREYFLARLLEP